MAGKCRVFVGPNFEKYKPVIGQLQNKTYPAGFNFLALIAPAGWLFYRKLYILGSVYFFIPMVLSFVNIGLGYLVGSVMAFYVLIFYKGIYAKHVLKRVDQISRDFSDDKQLKVELVRNGGVSLIGGWIVSIINFILGLSAPAAL